MTGMNGLAAGNHWSVPAGNPWRRTIGYWLGWVLLHAVCLAIAFAVTYRVGVPEGTELEGDYWLIVLVSCAPVVLVHWLALRVAEWLVFRKTLERGVKFGAGWLAVVAAFTASMVSQPLLAGLKAPGNVDPLIPLAGGAVWGLLQLTSLARVFRDSPVVAAIIWDSGYWSTLMLWVLANAAGCLALGWSLAAISGYVWNPALGPDLWAAASAGGICGVIYGAVSGLALAWRIGRLDR